MELLLAIGPGAMSGDPVPLLKGIALAVLALAGLGVVSAVLLGAQAVSLVVWAVLRGARAAGSLRPPREGSPGTRTPGPRRRR